MHEISSVLAGTYRTPDTIGTKANFTTGTPAPATTVTASTDAAPASQVEDRRYTKFDRTASNVATDTAFSFGDFLDMINPLQHIPVASSAYREAEGETIHPAARVAGDMLYGGIFGIASILASGIGAIGDSVMEQQTGKDMAGVAMASLFGEDKTSTAANTQVASASVGIQQPVAGAQQVGAPSQASMASVTQTPMTPLDIKANVKLAGAPAASSPVQDGAVTLPDGSKAFALNSKKQPYGGVIAPVATVQDQNMAMALSESSHTMRMGNMIYTNRFMNGAKPLSGSSSSQTASSASTTATIDASAPTAAPSPPGVASAISGPVDAQAAVATSGAQNNPIPQALMDDMMMMKALDQYRSLGHATPVPGAKLDLTN